MVSTEDGCRKRPKSPHYFRFSQPPQSESAMTDGTDAQRQAKREYTQLLRLHELLLGQLTRARYDLLAPGTNSLVKQIKCRTGSASGSQ